MRWCERRDLTHLRMTLAAWPESYGLMDGWAWCWRPFDSCGQPKPSRPRAAWSVLSSRSRASSTARRPSCSTTTDGWHGVMESGAIQTLPLGCSTWPMTRYRGPMTSQRVPGGVVHKLPGDLREALITNPRALDAWKDITPLARNEFICWVEAAKQETTRAPHPPDPRGAGGGPAPALLLARVHPPRAHRQTADRGRRGAPATAGGVTVGCGRPPDEVENGHPV